MRHYLLLFAWSAGQSQLTEWRVCYSDDDQDNQAVAQDVQVELTLHNIPWVLQAVLELPEGLPFFKPELDWGRFGGVYPLPVSPIEVPL